MEYYNTETSKTSNTTNIGVNTNSRMLYIHDDINKNTISGICYALLTMLDDDNKKEETEKNFTRQPIKIFINSNGGAVPDMWSLVDIILHSKTPIHTYCTGYAHSSGFLIFIAGHKRFISKHTQMICHQFSTTVRGPYQNHLEFREGMDRMWKDIEEYILERTEIPKVKLEDMREKKLDWLLFSEELIDMKVADEILTEF